jgi:hypothetical protein
LAIPAARVDDEQGVAIMAAWLLVKFHHIKNFTDVNISKTS